MSDKVGKAKRIKAFIKDLFELILFLLIGVVIFGVINIIFDDFVK